MDTRYVYSDTSKSGFPTVSGYEVEGHVARKVLHKEAFLATMRLPCIWSVLLIT